MFLKMYIRVACAAALVLMIGSPGATQMASRDRILQPVDSTQVALVKGTAHPLARPEFDQGRASSEQPITGAVVFRLSAAQQSDLDHLLRDQQNPSSRNYHQWLTPEQYADRFGMSRGDLAKVGAWLKSEGLTVNGVSRGRTEVYFSGSVGTVENAFRTEIHNYVVSGATHFANATALSIPTSLVAVVLSVRGLDNFRPKPMSRVRPISHFTSSISGSHFLIPADFAVIYNVNPLYAAGLDGSGVKIAVVGQSTLMPTTNSSTENATTDLDNFRSASGLPAKDPTAFVLVPASGTPAYKSGDALEADLDLEWSNAVAKNADVTYVYADKNHSAFDVINQVVNNGLSFAQIISNSFGLCEGDIGQSSAVALWQTIRQGNAQGQTIISSSGDTGAADCDGDQATIPKSASRGLAVDIPAAIPEITGVGGTEFTGDATATVTGTAPNTCASDNSPYWAGTCLLTSPSATAEKYIPETAWNDTAQSTQLSASGGGASTLFAKPSWQTGTGVPSDGARDVPDVALNASPNHDPYLICSEASFAGQTPAVTSCANGFRSSSSSSNNTNLLSAVGGTSAGSPTMAAILAIILQATKGTGLGNVNPMLYQLAATAPQVFHDITSGNNQVPCTTGSKNCPSGTSSIGFSAGIGYDQVTGLGSVDANQLEIAWLAATTSPDFVMDGSASTVAAGQPASPTINLTTLNGFADTVNLTCTPSSTTALITCSLNPTSVVLSGTNKAQSATLSITTVAALGPRLIPGSRGGWFAASGGLFAAVVLGGISSRRRWLGLLAMVLLASIIGAVGCGGSGSGTHQQKQAGTPAGTYTINVTGTGANTGITHSLRVSLTVQ
jgi:subtilase family serine protease